MNAKQLYQQQRRQRWGKGGRSVAAPLTMTNKDCQVIYGSMLGDGGTVYIKNRPGGNEHYKEKHSIAQKAYLDWKVYNCFYKWMRDPDKRYYHKKELAIIRGKDVKSGSMISIQTSKCPLFTVIGRRWYKMDSNGNYMLRTVGEHGRMERIKKMPWKLINKLDLKKNRGLILAVWYMDDGSYHLIKTKYFFIQLSTHSFTERENNILCDEFLWERFGIKGIVKQDKKDGKFYIQLNASGSRKFLYIVRPWVEQVPGMEYKLGIGKPPHVGEEPEEMHHVMQFDSTGDLIGVKKIKNYSEALMECLNA